jgi:hypothetical protein
VDWQPMVYRVHTSPLPMSDTNTDVTIIALEPLLDANRNYMRAGEVKSLTRQFQDDLASCMYPCRQSNLLLAEVVDQHNA